MKQLRIVIADDSALIRSLIREELSRVDGLLAVGEAADGMRAFWLYYRMSPHLFRGEIPSYRLEKRFRTKDGQRHCVVTLRQVGVLSERLDLCINRQTHVDRRFSTASLR